MSHYVSGFGDLAVLPIEDLRVAIHVLDTLIETGMERNEGYFYGCSGYRMEFEKKGIKRLRNWIREAKANRKAFHKALMRRPETHVAISLRKGRWVDEFGRFAKKPTEGLMKYA